MALNYMITSMRKKAGQLAMNKSHKEASIEIKSSPTYVKQSVRYQLLSLPTLMCVYLAAQFLCLNACIIYEGFHGELE